MSEPTPNDAPSPPPSTVGPPPASPASGAASPDESPTPRDWPAVEKSFLAQRFARLRFGGYSLIGYSVAGEETVVQAPELNVCFDIGRGPHFALTSDYLCLTHGHMDHIAGLPYYLSQRYFQGMKPGTVLAPRELERAVESMLRCWRDIERQNTPYQLVPMSPGQMYSVRRDLGIRAYATHHGGPSLGYGIISIREKLKPEYLGTPGQELAAMRKRGVEIQYRVEAPLVVFLGDTAAGPVFEEPDVRNAEILVTECTFFDADHRPKARAGRHLHLEQFAHILPRLNNKHIVLCHVSRRTGVGRAMRLLRRRVGDELLGNVHFLMDFAASANAGDIDDAVPLPDDDAG